MPWTQLGPASEPVPPAGRDDTAQPDHAVIERAAEAMRMVVTEAMASDAFCGSWCNNERSAHVRIARLVRLLVPSLAEAAAAVIVPATAERIAAVYADRAVRYRRSRGDYIDGCHGWHIADHYEQLALELRKGDNPALTFAAGLSAANVRRRR